VGGGSREGGGGGGGEGEVLDNLYVVVWNCKVFYLTGKKREEKKRNGRLGLTGKMHAGKKMKKLRKKKANVESRYGKKRHQKMGGEKPHHITNGGRIKENKKGKSSSYIGKGGKEWTQNNWCGGVWGGGFLGVGWGGGGGGRGGCGGGL